MDDDIGPRSNLGLTLALFAVAGAILGVGSAVILLPTTRSSATSSEVSLASVLADVGAGDVGRDGLAEADDVVDVDGDLLSAPTPEPEPSPPARPRRHR